MPENIGRYAREDLEHSAQRARLRSTDRIAVAAVYPYEKVTLTTWESTYRMYDSQTVGVSPMAPSSVSIDYAKRLAREFNYRGISAEPIKIITRLPEVVYDWAVEVRKAKSEGFTSFELAFPIHISRKLVDAMAAEGIGAGVKREALEKSIRESMRQLFDEIESDTHLTTGVAMYYSPDDFNAVVIASPTGWRLKTRFMVTSLITLFIVPMSEYHYFDYNLMVCSRHTGNQVSYSLRYGHTDLTSILLLPFTPFFRHNEAAFEEAVNQRLPEDISAFVKSAMVQ